MCAVGVPPRWVVDKLHTGGVMVGNMIGHPQHVEKALAAGVDLIIAQGSERRGRRRHSTFTIYYMGNLYGEDECQQSEGRRRMTAPPARRLGGRWPHGQRLHPATHPTVRGPPRDFDPL